MSEQNTTEQVNIDAGWLLKAAVLLIVFLAAFYVALMGSFGWKVNLRKDLDLLQLNASAFQTGMIEINQYGGVRKIYDIPITNLLTERDDMGIWLVHSYMEAYIDEEPIYISREPENDHIGHSPGCYWGFLPIEEKDQGKTLRLIITPAYRMVSGREPVIYTGRRDVIAGNRLLDEAAIVSVALLCIVGGIVFLLLTTSMIRGSQEQSVVFYLGLLLLFLGIWKLADTPAIYALILPFNGFLTYVTLIVLMLIIPALAAYLYHLLPEERGYFWANRIYLVFDAVLLLLQIMDIRDLRENLLLIQLGFLIFIVMMLEKSIYSLRKRVNWHMVAFILIGVSAIGDLVIYLYGFNSFYMGITLTASLFYGIMNGVMLLVKAYRQKEEIQHKNILLRESNMRLMMSQIRPHFIYNTLNAIYVLCGKEPERARKAIYDFSKYLRGNFEQMDRTEPVPFREELQHVRFYISIEQLRFPDALQVEYDIKEEDFSIPALTLQPLVENAVRHGIRATNRTGMIRISSFLENGEVCVAVEDDGEGFDVAEWEKNIRENGGEDESGRRHVGLANVRERIRKYGGDLLIESKKGVGTQMILCIRTP
ncbi:MAG: histidine kinase [Lachnospiraceae bacterium]|nr:histidine kinase [Lachnospiraceae bacterium]